MDRNKVVLGLSGGVDSAAAALRLKEKGMEVIALYFDIEENVDLSSERRARAISEQLNIQFEYVNLHDRFNKLIVEPFCRAYVNGQTPSPCVLCNPYIKWWILKKYADENNAYWIASGHYSDLVCSDGAYYVKKSANGFKDQSYMLAGLDQSFLRRIIFPLSDFTDKKDVKAYAASKGLNIVENVAESMDICFINTNYKDFLKAKGYAAKPGNFLSESGEIIGKHGSYYDFTIGQGKGFGMGFNKKMYVKSVNPESGDVVLCEDESLYTDSVKISLFNFAKYGAVDSIPTEYLNREFDVKIRYAAKPVKAVLLSSSDKNSAELKFSTPVRAAAAGQFAVIYDKDCVIGCGIIC